MGVEALHKERGAEARELLPPAELLAVGAQGEVRATSERVAHKAREGAYAHLDKAPHALLI